MTAWVVTANDVVGNVDATSPRLYFQAQFVPPAGIDQSFYAWNTPGFTVQNELPYVGGYGVNGPVIPNNVSMVTVTGSYADFGYSLVTGHVIFWPMIPNNSRLIDSAGAAVILPAQITVPVNNGSFSVVLPASNDPDVTPTFQYLISEFIPGGRVNFYATLDYRSLTVDISQLG